MGDQLSVKLIGVDGNAFSIIGQCKAAMMKAKWPRDKMDAVVNDMMSGDYDHLLQVVLDTFIVE